MENLDSASSSDDTDAPTPTRSRSSSTSSASEPRAEPDDASSDSDATTALGDNDSDSDSSDGEGAPAEDDVYRLARVLAAAVRCMHAAPAAMRAPAVRACLAANDCRLPETADDLVRMVYNCAPDAYGDKPGAVAAHAEVAAAAERALTHTQKKGSSVQAIYHMLTTDPTIKKVLQTLGFSVKNFHDIALKLSKRLGKLELDITLKTLTNVVEVLLPFIIKIVFHAIFVGSPDMPADALVAPGVTLCDVGGALFASELDYHLRRQAPAAYGDTPAAGDIASTLLAAINAKFPAAAERSDDDDEAWDDLSEDALPAPPSESEDASEESDAATALGSDDEDAPPVPPRPAMSAAGEAALGRPPAGAADRRRGGGGGRGGEGAARAQEHPRRGRVRRAQPRPRRAVGRGQAARARHDRRGARGARRGAQGRAPPPRRPA